MPRTRKHFVVLFVLVFAFKLAFSIYFSQYAISRNPENGFGRIAVKSGDTFSYLGVMDNLLAEGDYYFWNGARKVYAGRMPYYGAPYLLLRAVFDKQSAGDVYVLLQIAADALATIFFALLCFDVLRSKTAFWCSFFVHAGSLTFAVFGASLYLSPESLSLSFFVFFLYFYQRFWSGEKQSDLIFASIFLAFITLLKPYFVIVYPAVLLGVLIRQKTLGFSDIKFFFRQSAVLGLPLLIFLTPWIVRNWIVLDKFIPAQENQRAGYNYSQADRSFANFAGAWGGGETVLDPYDAGCYFYLNHVCQCDFQIPRHALTDGYNIGEIERVRQNFFELQENYSPESDRIVAAEFDRLTEIYRREKPFMYHVGAKFIILKSLFGYNYICPEARRDFNFSLSELPRSAFKASQFLLYLSSLTLGVFGLLNLARRRQISFVFIIVPLIVILFFVEIRATEIRYANHVHLILRLGLAAVLTNFISWIWLQKQKTNAKIDDNH